MKADPEDVWRPGKILLATDGSPDAELAARAATDLAGRTGAELHVAHAWHQDVQDFGYPTVVWTDYSYLFEREARRRIGEQVDAIEAAGGVVARQHLLRGPTIDVCEKLQPGLLVMGSRGLGPVGRARLGSVSEGVVHHARVPVLVARGGAEAWPPGRVVIGDDGSDAARAAGDLAIRLGGLFETSSVLVRAVPEPVLPMQLPEYEQDLHDRLIEDSRRLGEKALRERATELGEARSETRLATGDATLAVLGVAADDPSTLVAVGSRGLGGTKRMLLGSVSTKLLRMTKGPVLVYPRPAG